MHLRQVTHSDLPAFSKAVALAMWDDEVMAYTSPYKDKYPLSFERYVTYRASKRFYAGQFLFLVVSDANDALWTGHEVVIGYCCYSTNIKSVTKPCPGGFLGNTFERWALDLYGRYSQLFHLDSSADPMAERHFRKVAERDMFEGYFAGLPATHRSMKGDEHWELELLGTIPEFQRRGVGKFALSWGFEKAREYGVPLVLLASHAGEKLYEKIGFGVFAKVNMLLPAEDSSNTKATEDLLPNPFEYGQRFDSLNGLEWSAMVWEPESLRQEREKELASKTTIEHT